MVAALGAFAVGEGPLVLGDRLFRPACLLVGLGQAAPCGQRVRVVGAQCPFPVGEGPLEQGNGVIQAPRLLVGVGEVAVGGQGLGVARTQRPFPVGQGPLVHPDGRARPSCCSLRRGQAITDEECLGVTRSQPFGADRAHVPPVGDGRPAEPGGIQALPGPDQHLVALRRPEQVGRGRVQHYRAAPQGLGQHRLLGVSLRPRFE